MEERIMLPERDTGGKSGQRSLICPLRSSKVKGQCNQCGRGRPPAKGLKKIRCGFDLPVNGGRSSGHSVYYSLGSLRKGAEPVRDPVLAKVTHGCVVRRQWAGEAGHGGRGLLQGAMRSRGLLSGGLEEQL